MKLLVITFFTMACAFAKVLASQPTLTTVTQPLFFLGSASGNEEIQLITVPKIQRGVDADAWVALYYAPTTVAGSTEDLNLISVYGIRVSIVSQDSKGRIQQLAIDVTKAQKPERYSFSIDEVVKAAERAIRKDFPNTERTTIRVINGQNVTKPDPKPRSQE